MIRFLEMFLFVFESDLKKQSQNARFQPEMLNSTLNQERYRAKSEILNENECSVVSDSHPHSDKQHRNEDATHIREYCLCHRCLCHR